MEWLNVLIQGIALGGLFSLFATGLSLIFGVMRLINLSHGDLIVLASFIAITMIDILQFHPLISFVIIGGVMFALGYILQTFVFNKVIGEDIMPPILVAFGLSIAIQNVLLEIFSADTRKLQIGSLDTASITISDTISIGWFPLIIVVVAVLVIWGFQKLFYTTDIGKQFRATSDDPETAKLMGIDNKHIFALAMGIAMFTCAIAGTLLAMRTNISPDIGPSRLLFAFEAVIIGGLGNPWGTLVGGMILGISQSIGAYIHPAIQILSGHLVFLLILIFRPTGLFPKRKD